jgi:hypothetical protein
MITIGLMHPAVVATWSTGTNCTPTRRAVLTMRLGATCSAGICWPIVRERSSHNCVDLGNNRYTRRPHWRAGCVTSTLVNIHSGLQPGQRI